MNRHYMKEAAPARLAAESTRYFAARGYLLRRTDEAMEYLVSVLPMAVGSVDRLEEIPDRLRFLFEFDPAAALTRDEVASVLHESGARQVIAALSDAIEGPLKDRESFRAMANRVKERTGLKGKALFHPIRVVLTGEGAGLNYGVIARVKPGYTWSEALGAMLTSEVDRWAPIIKAAGQYAD